MHVRYRNVSFLTSAAEIGQAPSDTGVEVAFAGRSNAGKSSAINALCQQKSLARTSKTPGRTRLLNFFALDDEKRLVDLPGYGFAKVPEPVKLQWQRLLEDYLARRQSLRGLILLMDCRHPLTDFDQRMLEWNGFHGVPTHILLTKADKLGRGAAGNVVLKVRREISGRAGENSAQLFSALDLQGLDEAYAVLDRWFQFDADDPPGSRLTTPRADKEKPRHQRGEGVGVNGPGRSSRASGPPKGKSGPR